MKQLLLSFFLLVFSFASRAQDFTGQWKGSFVDNSTKYMSFGGDKCDYVLELDCSGTNVTGYSYTYFSDAGRKYFTICRLVGTIDRKTKSVVVTEVERTKTNVPSTVRNCFQVHKLTYVKEGDAQTIQGDWEPAPGQVGDCGFGTTKLARRVLVKNASLAKIKPVAKPKVTTPGKPSTDIAKTKTVTPFKAPVPKKVTLPAVAAAKPKTPPVVVARPPSTAIAKATVPAKPLISMQGNAKDPGKPVETNDRSVPDINRAIPPSFEKRDNNLLKTIDIENESFKVDLYDNGEIDGDSISLFFNGKLLLAHKRLSDRALTLTLDVDNAMQMNELIMYADNLGSIPPNTALMVVTDGNKRYEVRISSDLEKSGVIRFIHKPKGAQ